MSAAPTSLRTGVMSVTIPLTDISPELFNIITGGIMNTKIELGDRFEDRDPRNKGRVVEVIQETTESGEVRVKTEVHPNNPSAVGRRIWMKSTTLLKRFDRISR